MSDTKSRFRALTDRQCETVEDLLPSSNGQRGRPFRNSRLLLEGIIYRYRTGIPWRDLPRDEFGPDPRIVDTGDVIRKQISG